ncbi:hypothetical protein BLA29_015073 [Euroglyphus maynei]|uniref:Uncharacterized protein n=1 Tax=Euroglyphus maynei TaxID=6958 RepID=A0A1Y3BGZ1_EURMA|nr:hypothetical protein BLA29_015073 [Euroglyphus maynei]
MLSIQIGSNESLL